MDVAGEVLAVDRVVEGRVEVLVGVGTGDGACFGAFVGTLLEMDSFCDEAEHGVEL